MNNTLYILEAIQMKVQNIFISCLSLFMPWLEIRLESLHLEGIHFRVPAPQCLQDTLQNLAMSLGRIWGQRTFKNIVLLGGVEQALLAMKEVIWEWTCPFENRSFGLQSTTMYIMWAETQTTSVTTILLTAEVWIGLFRTLCKFDELQSNSRSWHNHFLPGRFM